MLVVEAGVSEAVALCVAGLTGVFVGMTLLYVAIRVTAVLVDRFRDPGTGDG